MTEPRRWTSLAAMTPDVRLRRQSDYRFRVEFASGAPALVTDEAPPLGNGAGPDPAAMLAAAVGNCLASSLLFCVRKARIEPAGLDVEVRLARARNPEGRLRITRVAVRLVPHLTADDRARIGRCLELFESFCVVTESIRPAIPVDVAVEPVTVAAPVRATPVSGGGAANDEPRCAAFRTRARARRVVARGGTP